MTLNDGGVLDCLQAILYYFESVVFIYLYCVRWLSTPLMCVRMQTTISHAKMWWWVSTKKAFHYQECMMTGHTEPPREKQNNRGYLQKVVRALKKIESAICNFTTFLIPKFQPIIRNNSQSANKTHTQTKPDTHEERVSWFIHAFLIYFERAPPPRRTHWMLREAPSHLISIRQSFVSHVWASTVLYSDYLSDQNFSLSLLFFYARNSRPLRIGWVTLRCWWCNQSITPHSTNINKLSPCHPSSDHSI
jgi:hypothetical protein